MRSALGAGRWRLVRQLLTESTVLAVVGGGLGVLMAYALRSVLPQVLRPGANTPALDMEPRAFLLLFSTLVCLLTGFACGLVPALRATRIGASPVLTRAVLGAADGPRRLWGGPTLVAFQVAISLVLLAAGALFVQTMVNLKTQAMGFRPERLLVFQMNATLDGYQSERLNDFYKQVIERISALPGVRAVSCSRYGIPGQGARRDGLRVIDADGSYGQESGAHVHAIAPDYFETMGIALPLGRDVTWADRSDAPLVAVVNEAFARKLYRRASPLGRRFQMGQDTIEIVGVAGDVTFQDIRHAPPPTVDLVGSVRATLAGLDPDVPIYAVRTQEQQIELAIQQPRLFAYLVSSAAVLALLLACLGIYGTLAYSVARRTSEIGVRMALGAEPARVVTMVLRESLAPVVTGVTIGLVAALGGAHLVGAMLFGLQPTDVRTLVAVVLLLVAAALLAAWLPSYRASRVQPISALRCD
jgi:predicted lysophospholipase L1 biosynthesis ABC-type transport system permease subunit